TCCGPCASENHESAAIDPGSLSSESLPSSPKHFVQVDVKRDRTHEQLSAIWAKTTAVARNDQNEWRKDACGAWIGW
ncbi:MAG: hypothetical protein M3436_11010, partial [Pseudomonadota bacterium]|nr:hypothetical protein [Pseudomonadota bacterium]